MSKKFTKKRKKIQAKFSAAGIFIAQNKTQNNSEAEDKTWRNFDRAK